MKKFLLPLLLGALLQSCLKSKQENIIPPLSTVNTAPSSIRLFNLSASALDIEVNNYPLTSFASNLSTGETALGQTLFPTGVWPSSPNGTPVTLPQVLLDKNNQAHVHILSRTGIGQQTPILIDTILQNDPAQPKDYYITDNNTHLIVQNQNNTPPVQAQDFKIRIINLGAPGDPLNLYGSVTLTYADGTPVSPATTGVAPGVTGNYVELPYGANEFKLFLSGGAQIDVTRQLAELPLHPNYDPCGSKPPQEAIFPQLRTYKPGGVYSLVITTNLFNYWACNSGRTSEVGVFLNAYRVITELTPGNNITFARMQGVNALQTGPLTFQVDGQPLGNALGFGQAGDYSIFVQGSHQISVLDAGGKTLVQKSITLYPYDNYALWAYPDPDGTPDLDFASVDMTGYAYLSRPNNSTGYDDGTSGSLRILQVPYAWETRFLNLAPDQPYATFTNDSVLLTAGQTAGDSTIYAASCVNMAPGFMPAVNPYVAYSLPYVAPQDANPQIQGSMRPPAVIRAYSSSPGPEVEIPGTLLTQVAPMYGSKGFVANPALYTNGLLPLGEPGAYTLALIGKVSSGAQLIVIKHNK